MINFKQFIQESQEDYTIGLLEANYGALQSDKRIHRIRDILVAEIKKEMLKKEDTEIHFFSPIEPILALRIVKKEHSSSLIFHSGAHILITGASSDGTIIIYINPNIDYKTAIENIHEIYPLLSHEIKHALDYYDGKFKSDSADANTEYNSYKKYVTDIKEIDNFLITVLEELENYRLRNRDSSFSEALANNFWWNHLYDRALYDYSKLNKFKSKLANFWNTKKPVPKKPEDIKKYKVQMMLLLYLKHKDEMPELKASGKNVKYTLQTIVNRYSTSVENIKKAINTLKEQLKERGL